MGRDKLILLSVCFLALILVSPVYAAKNLLVNGDFEEVSDPDKLPDNWSKYQPAKGTESTFSSVLDAATSHSGNGYVKCEIIKAKEGGYSDVSCDIRFELTRGENYKITAWVKGEGIFMLRCYAYKEGKEYLPKAGPQSEKIEVKDEEWKEYTWEYSTEEENEVIWFALHIFEGTLFFDDVSFYVKQPEE